MSETFDRDARNEQAYWGVSQSGTAPSLPRIRLQIRILPLRRSDRVPNPVGQITERAGDGGRSIQPPHLTDPDSPLSPSGVCFHCRLGVKSIGRNEHENV